MTDEPAKRGRGRPPKGSPEERTRKEALRSLRAHAKAHGPHGFEVVRARYPDVPANTFSYWVKKVRKEFESKAVRDAERIGVAHHVPGPMPQVLMDIAKFADARVELISMVNQLAYDAALLRASGLVTDPTTGEEKIRNYVVFESSIKRRTEIIKTVLAVQQEVYDVNRMSEAYDEIIRIITEEIAPLDKEVVQRIAARLKALNDKRLLTVHADPSAAS